MNKQNFTNQEHGQFPLSVESLDFMQQMIYATADLALIGGNNYILSGCGESGGVVADGLIVVNGEIIPLRRGAKGKTITIIEEKTPVTAKDMTFRDARVTRYAKFATGNTPNYYNWDTFKRLSTNLQLQQSIDTLAQSLTDLSGRGIPAGIICMWSGQATKIPAGWALCNGQNGTPDLQKKFVVGYSAAAAGYNLVGLTGGAESFTLEEKHIPSHSHYVNSAERGGCKSGSSFDSGVRSWNDNSGFKDTAYTNPWGGDKSGKAQPIDNRPPFYVIAFIMKL